MLGAEHAVGVGAAHGDGRAVQADRLARGRVVDGDLPAAALAVGQVHAEEHLAPVLRLQAALPRVDVDDGVAVVELVGKPARQLELVKIVGQAPADVGRLLKRLFVLELAAQLERRLGVFEPRMCPLDRRHVVFRLGQAGHRRLRGRRVVPKARHRALSLELRDHPAPLFDMQILLDARKPSLEPIDPVL